MACNIVLIEVRGTDDPNTHCLQLVEVSGRTDCERIKGILTLGNDRFFANGNVGDNGLWNLRFDTRVPPGEACSKCGQSFELTIECEDVPDCARDFNGIIECPEPEQPGDDCPQLVFNNASDPEPCDENGRRAVRFFATVIAGNARADVRFEADGNAPSPRVVIPPNVAQPVAHTFSLQPGGGEAVRLVVIAPADCNGIPLPAPALEPCPDQNNDCPNITIHNAIVSPDCVDGQRRVELRATVRSGNELCVVQWQAGNPDNDTGGVCVVPAGAELPCNEPFLYPVGQAFQATLMIAAPQGCENVVVPIGPFACDEGERPCPSANDFTLFVAPVELDCQGIGQRVFIEVRNADQSVIPAGEYDFRWQVNGEVLPDNDRFVQIVMGNVATTVEVEISQQDCEAATLATDLEPCPCPDYDNALSIDVDRDAEGSRDGRDCYRNQGADPLGFTLNGDNIDAGVLAATAWRLYRLDGDEQEQQPNNRIQQNGPQAAVPLARLQTGDYRLVATIHPVPGCPQHATIDFFVCPKDEDVCPEFEISAEVNDEGNAVIQVHIPAGPGQDQARARGFELDFGDGGGAEIAGEDGNVEGVWTVEHRYPASDEPYVIRVSDPGLGADCGASVELAIEAPPRPPRGGDDCGIFDFSCWSICKLILGLIATAVTTLLIVELTIAPPAAVTGVQTALIAVLIAWYVSVECSPCALGLGFLTAVATYLVVLIVLALTGGAIPGAVNSGLLAAGFAAAGGILARKC